MTVLALNGLQSNLILTLPLAGTVAAGVFGSWWYDRWRRRRVASKWILVQEQLRRVKADDGAGRCG